MASSGHLESEDDDVGHEDRDYELLLSRYFIGSTILFVDQHRHLLTNSHRVERRQGPVRP